MLLEINFFPVIGRRPDEVLAMLRGRPGSVIEIAVRRPDGERRLPVTRQLVREIPTRARTLETGIGYIRLLEFSEDASQDFQRALGRLTAQGARALVLDLRDNGGGLVDEAVLVASALLSPGPVAIEETRRGQLIVLVRPVAQRFSGPIVVLVNHQSASSSEIVAGALQDAGATLIGEKTFGKGTVQSIYALAAGWGLRLTTARYLTPKRRPIDGVGLLPELAVVSPADQVTGLGDFQLETARVLARRRLSAVGAGR